MAKFSMTFSCDSTDLQIEVAPDVFEVNRYEVERVVRKVADRMRDQYVRSGIITDDNGNTIGSFAVDET